MELFGFSILYLFASSRRSWRSRARPVPGVAGPRLMRSRADLTRIDAEQARRRRMRSLAIALALGFMVLLFYA